MGDGENFKVFLGYIELTDESISTLKVRLPGGESEIAVDTKLLGDQGLKVTDAIELSISGTSVGIRRHILTKEEVAQNKADVEGIVTGINLNEIADKFGCR